MQVFDSRTEKLISLDPNTKVRLFVCGPTVYDHQHIGNFRTSVAFDTLVRTMRAKGYDVFYLQNITDVDDKIITRAQEQQRSPFSLAREYEDHYHTMEQRLNIRSITKYARASDYIPEIIAQIQRLIDKGFAYETENGIYFEVRRFPTYGELSRQNLDALRPGYRIEPDDQKKDPLDFALWKKSKHHTDIKPKKNPFVKGKPVVLMGEPAWISPWGWGRPGWHIEDTAITEKFFGSQYDIHGGGVDIRFPHHESEIAQQEAASGKHPLVNIWMHAGTLLVNGEKMSKSLGNFITAQELLQHYSPNTFRFMVLSVSYRSPLNYTDEAARSAQTAFDSLEHFLKKISFILLKRRSMSSPTTEGTIDVAPYLQRFSDALDHDFNAPEAVGTLFSLIKDVEPQLFSLPSEHLKKVSSFVSSSLEMLGFKDFAQEKPVPTPVRKLAQEREEARGNKQFMHADDLRNKIHELGYTVDDTPIGPFLYRHS